MPWQYTYVGSRRVDTSVGDSQASLQDRLVRFERGAYLLALPPLEVTLVQDGDQDACRSVSGYMVGKRSCGEAVEHMPSDVGKERAPKQNRPPKQIRAPTMKFT